MFPNDQLENFLTMETYEPGKIIKLTQVLIILPYFTLIVHELIMTMSSHHSTPVIAPFPSKINLGYIMIPMCFTL